MGGFWVQVIETLCIAPALLDKIEFAMEFRKKMNLEVLVFECGLKNGVNVCKIWLRI